MPPDAAFCSLGQDGFEKYMYLGQLVDGPEACECFRRGVALMEREAAAAAACAPPCRQRSQPSQRCTVRISAQLADAISDH